jgi:hypothetical protein
MRMKPASGLRSPIVWEGRSRGLSHNYRSTCRDPRVRACLSGPGYPHSKAPFSAYWVRRH